MLDDDQLPSTSIASDGRGLVREWVISNEYLDDMKNKFELITQRFQKILQPLNAVSHSILQWGPINRRVDNVREGWQRVKNIYHQENPHSFEWELIKKAFYLSFMAGVLTGGLDTIKKSVERFELYKAGKEFGTLGHLMQRKTDFVLTQFYKRGFFKGLWLSAYICSIVAVTVGIAAYRDHYSILYFPITTTSIFSMFAFVRGVGIHGFAMAFFISFFPSVLLTTITLGASFYSGISVDEGYKNLKQKYLIETKKEIEEDEELIRYVKSKGGQFVFKPWHRYKMKFEKELGTFNRNVTLGDDEELLKFGGEDK
ncbi:hypothetical protein ACQ4LE_008938 [Meloidogyne hapla]|uniref:Uncharacterized protein n=1 Tax=Meloidogyne hapla TaxID=6305 RepID=A0A1I8B8N2_MELHA